MRKHIENKQKNKATLSTFIKHSSTRLLKALEIEIWASSYKATRLLFLETGQYIKSNNKILTLAAAQAN